MYEAVLDIGCFNLLYAHIAWLDILHFICFNCFGMPAVCCVTLQQMLQAILAGLAPILYGICYLLPESMTQLYQTCRRARASKP